MKLEAEALDRTVWRAGFGRGCRKTDNMMMMMMMMMWVAALVFVVTESWVQNPAGEFAYSWPVKVVDTDGT